MASRLCVMGAIHLDIVVSTPRFPRAGERVVAEAFASSAGGRGARLAVAAARLGADVDLVGCLGEDAFGADLRSRFVAEGVDVRHVSTRAGGQTGLGLIGALPGGEVGALVVPGVDSDFGVQDVERARDTIETASLLALQLELPLPAVLRAARIAREKAVPILLDASPPTELPHELLDLVDTLVVAKSDALRLLREEGEIGATGMARRLGALGPKRVVVANRGRSAVLFDGEQVFECAGFGVEPIDGTGARDAFTGALAVALLAGVRPEEALKSACAAGALASMRRGALPSLPTRDQLVAFLARPTRA